MKMLTPEVEVLRFDAGDVIATSGDPFAAFRKFELENRDKAFYVYGLGSDRQAAGQNLLVRDKDGNSVSSDKIITIDGSNYNLSVLEGKTSSELSVLGVGDGAYVALSAKTYRHDVFFTESSN